MKNTETQKIVGGGYSSPEMNVIFARIEHGFCQSGKIGNCSTNDLTEAEGTDYFNWI